MFVVILTDEADFNKYHITEKKEKKYIFMGQKAANNSEHRWTGCASIHQSFGASYFSLLKM